MSFVAACGSFVPEQKTTNRAIEAELDLPAGWIEQRTGVKTRPVADVSDAVSDISIRAGKVALARLKEQGVQASVSSLILATSTPDFPLPPTAPKIAYQLGLANAAAMDLAVACSGFLYGLIVADSLLRSGTAEQVLVIAANILSRRCGPKDPATRAVFADGAGAAVLAQSETNRGVVETCWESEGQYHDLLKIEDGGSRNPIGPDTFKNQRHVMQLGDGGGMFRYAVESMAKMGKEVTEKAGLSIEDIDWWVPHQANIRIIESCRRILKIPAEKTLTSLAELGNSSAATIPITLDRFSFGQQRRIKENDLVLLTCAAAGATSAGVLIRW